MKQILLDTCILIDYLRNYPGAIEFINSIEHRPLISSLTIGELYAGIREGKERESLDNLTATWEVVPLTATIAKQGGLYRRDYYKSHGVGIIDALIAAITEHHNATLVTNNTKHFPMLKDVVKPY